MRKPTTHLADYRQVDGLRLSFIQRVSAGGRLVYDLIFSAIDLNPAFPRDYFDLGAVAREGGS
jgi:hypothetical protein